MTPSRTAHNARHARECVEACERTYSEDERVAAFLWALWKAHALPDRQAELRLIARVDTAKRQRGAKR